ncbi:MAG: hypothetical protein ACLFWF_13275 [Alphaproteobacteria bacterium]
MNDLWPWLTLAGLGAFHGVNPAMGWLFAVALGQHRHSRRVVLLSLLPIAAGHAASIAAVAGAVLFLGVVINQTVLQRAAGVLLIGWAVWHAIYGHRRRVRIGMQTGMAGLALWSFLMATAHGAGLMLVPVLIPLCLGTSAVPAKTAEASVITGLAAVTVHSLAMLAVTGAIALAVYEWLGLAFLRRGWINLDLLWSLALAGAGLILLLLL